MRRNAGLFSTMLVVFSLLVGGTITDASPQGRITLSLGKVATIKADMCKLTVAKNTPQLIKIVCKGTSILGTNLISSPEVATAVVLHAGEKQVVAAIGCSLVITRKRSSVVKIACISNATNTLTSTSTNTPTPTPTNTLTPTPTNTLTPSPTNTPTATATPCGSLSGVISTSLTLNEDCQYLITGNSLISAGAILTIEPGVKLKFAGNYYLLIDGNFYANGTAAKPIYITSNQPAPQRGDWKRVIFRSTTNEASIDHAVIEYGGSSDSGTYSNGAIFVDTGAKLKIDNSTIKSNTSHAIYDNGAITITNSIITDNRGGLVLNNNGAATLITDTLSYNGPLHTITSSSPSGKTKIYASTFISNTAEWTVPIIELKGDGDVLEGSSIMFNEPQTGSVVISTERNATVRLNAICKNIPHNTMSYPPSSRAVVAIGNSSVYFKENNIDLPNQGYAVSGWAASNVDISANYWQTTDSSVIAGSIYDYYDDPLMAKYIFAPIATTPVAGAVTNCSLP